MGASGNSFTLNSIDYGDATHNLYVADYAFVSVGKPRVQTVELADSDGVVSWGNKYGSKLFTLDCWVVADTTTNLETWMDNIATAWKAAHAAGVTSFSIDLQSRTYASSRPNSGIITKVQGITGNQIQLKVLCTDGAET